jgi:hypothetical protein
MQPITIMLAMAAQAAAEAPAPALPSSANPDIKVTCRVERVTGSRMVKRTCRNVEQQRQADLEARNKLRLGSQVQTTDAFKAPAGQ